MPILRTIKKQGCYVSLNTNGVYLAAHAEDLLECGVDKIIVSLDGPPETHDAVRGPSFEALEAGIRKIQELKRERGLPLPQLRLQCVISHLNLDRLHDTVEAAKQLGCGEIRFQHPIFTYSKDACVISKGLKDTLSRFDMSRPSKQWIDVTGDAVQDVIMQLVAAADKEVKIAFEPDVASRDVVGYYDDAEYPFPDLCLSPWRRMDVSPFGEMGPCQGVYLGQFPAVEPDACWNSPEFRSLRRQMIDGGLFGFCNRCCHREYRAPRMLGLGIS